VPGEERTFFSISCSVDALPIGRLTRQHRDALSYWNERRGNHAAPRRVDINPFEIPLVLPNVAIWSIDGANDYLCRLAGTDIDRSMGCSLTGVALGSISCTLLDEARREFDAVRDAAMLSYSERTMGWLGKPHSYYRHLLVPLTNEHRAVHMLLSVLTFHNAAERYG